jgi:hypothetical protein
MILKTQIFLLIRAILFVGLLSTLGIFYAPVASAQSAQAKQAATQTLQKHPDILSAKVQTKAADTFYFDVTVSSPYDTAQRYADAFRVMGADGTVFGERILLHDHATEQPFTRELDAVKIPRNIRSVVIQGRDQKYGYGGKTITVALPGR